MNETIFTNKQMKNYKINMNREPLSDADITKGKDFDRLLKKYNAAKDPIYKTIKFWFGASALAAAAITGVLLFNYNNNPPNRAPFINPPIAAVNIPTTGYQVNTERDSTITYSSGSRIHIPANAFLDAKGNAVKGKVDIHYREFKKISEVFLSGIPMTYDSAGEQYHFETAGMIEISATQNGASLQPNPNAVISVDMVSLNNENRFNTYYLDTVERKWKYMAQTNYQQPVAGETGATVQQPEQKNKPGEKEATKLKALDHEIAKLQAQKPVEPEKLNRAKPLITIKVEPNEFPEIAVYNHVKFQVNDKTYDPAKADIVWENIEMHRINNSQNYEITFSKAGQQYRVIAAPVFDDKDYASARKIYEEKYAEYQTKLAGRKAEEAKLKAEMEVRQKAAEEAVQREMAEMEAHRKQYEANLSQTDLVYRTFQVSCFGVWNCDCPNRLPQGESVIATIVDAKTGRPLNVQNLFLVEKGRNLMFSYNANTLSNFRFDPNKENMVWAVTSDSRVAIIRPEQFKESKRKGADMVLELNVIDKKFTSTEEAKEYLEI